jgi:predicted Rossmann fold flavoprotein
VSIISPHHDVIILGAGAAGLMCAITAGQRGRNVLLLDHAAEPGAKILISGGGRCNFTNVFTAPDRFLSDNPHFARSALGRYTADNFITLVQRHGIAFHEKTKGQLFCDGSARAIVGMLMREAEQAGVTFRFGHKITSLGKSDSFHIETDQGSFTASSLVLATGGLSIPKLGATGFAYDAARRFGLRITETRPGLVPLTFGDELLAMMRPLAGVSLDTEANHDHQSFREASLFTHRGLSGPAILQISSYWRDGPIVLNLLPEFDAATFLLDRKRTRPKAELPTILAEILPRRLAQALDIEATRLADIQDRTLRALATKLNAWTITPNGTEGFAKAEVTVGGIDTRDLSSKTMEATKVPGLFAIGEAVDVTGWLGGYNFQWAWASGWCAGEAA